MTNDHLVHLQLHDNNRHARSDWSNGMLYRFIDILAGRTDDK